MEKEKEDLERQIRLLQGLISCHRKLHGNAPATSRWRNPAQPDHGSDESYHGGGRPPPSSNPTHTWRKKYSLVNRCEPAGPAPRVPSNAPSGGDASAPPPLSDGQIRNPKVGVKDPNTAVCPLQVPTTRGGRSNLQHVKHRTHPESPSTSAAWQTHPKPLAPAAPPSKATSKASLDVRPPSFPPDKAGPPRGASAKLVYPRVMTASPVAPTSSNARVDPAKRRLVTPHKMFCSPKSIFALQGSAPHASKTPRARKNKYTWVANSAKPGLCGKKSSPLAKKIVSADAVRTKSPTAAVTTKAKKCSIQGKPGTSRNRYRWKANQPSLTPSGPASVLLHLSVPQSTDQGSAPRLQGPSREAGKGLASPAALKASLKDQMPSSYKVKSRTKLIRRRSSSSPTEKKALPLEPLTMKSRYSLRRRSSPRVKTQIVVKKTSPKGLVHITKHRLRRLPPPKQPDVSRAGPAALVLKSPSPSRVIKTRYRIVKRIASPALSSTFSPSLNARTRLLTRFHPSPPGGRILPGQQRWRSRGLCVIGGHMYRVSANKLSRTWSPGSTSKQTPKAGKKDLRSPSPGASYSGRPATPSQYIASRAVQRSLAIIRQAQQRKDKEYCMYYNRFGKCNRAQSCPYIHDPEKVAVCTRFLRGTCKKTDGTCPFSHHVSKEKMPVCSYFLKGACHNSDCPYSHVYVSRKAALCQDFIKGYCPLGEKCKKKHTLLCPDYARDGRCARGAKCQLQHRQRKRRHDDPTRPGPEHKLPAESRTRDGDLLDRSGMCSSDDEFPGATSDKLPSFISLNCSLSPSSDVTPQTKKVKPAEDAGKPLHIKPRL